MVIYVKFLTKMVLTYLTHMKARIKVRPIQETNFKDLDEYFGLSTVYKKPVEHWQKYLEETQVGIRLAVIAEMDGKTIGYATLKFESEYSSFKNTGTPEINDLGVAPSERNSGVGRSMIEFLEQAAKEKGCKEIGIGFGLYNDYGPAQRLYIKMGYIPDGRGVMYNYQPVVPGKSYPVDDELVLFFTKAL